MVGHWANVRTKNCSIARTLELVGERWTLLIVRQALLGTRRFDAFQSVHQGSRVTC